MSVAVILFPSTQNSFYCRDVLQPGPCLGEPCVGGRAWLKGTFIREAASVRTSRRTREQRGARFILVQPASSDGSQHSPGLPVCLMLSPHRPNDKCQLNQPGRWVSYTTPTLCRWAKRGKRSALVTCAQVVNGVRGSLTQSFSCCPVHLWVTLYFNRMSMVEGPSTPVLHSMP